MKTKYLLLWLEAPLQSWGADSKFGRRDTLTFPTKSGIAGLMLCALGASGEQKELLERLAPLRQTVISYVPLKEKDGKKQKSDREPLLRDFHMVGSGYDDANPWEKLLIPKTLEGKPAVGGGTKITYRYYLQGAKFAVIVEVSEELVDEIAYALQNPVYDIYLGRKNCVPTDIVFQGVFENEEEAVKKATQIAKEKDGLLVDFKVVDGENNNAGEAMTLNDVPVRFGEAKLYRDRRVTVVTL